MKKALLFVSILLLSCITFSPKTYAQQELLPVSNGYNMTGLEWESNFSNPVHVDYLLIYHTPFVFFDYWITLDNSSFPTATKTAELPTYTTFTLDYNNVKQGGSPASNYFTNIRENFSVMGGSGYLDDITNVRYFGNIAPPSTHDQNTIDTTNNSLTDTVTNTNSAMATAVPIGLGVLITTKLLFNGLAWFKGIAGLKR